MFKFKQKEKATQANDTIIGENAVFRGKISGHGKVTISGNVEGVIEVLNEVVIDLTGSFNGKLIANDVVIAGRYKGNADVCGDVHLFSSAYVTCDVKARALISDEGAFFNGNCELHQNNVTQRLNERPHLIKS